MKGSDRDVNSYSYAVSILVSIIFARIILAPFKNSLCILLQVAHEIVVLPNKFSMTPVLEVEPQMRRNYIAVVSVGQTDG